MLPHAEIRVSARLGSLLLPYISTYDPKMTLSSVNSEYVLVILI